MGLFILTETSAGYGLFKAADKKLLDTDDLASRLSTAEKIAKEIKYKEFSKFDSAAAALEEINGIIEGKVTPQLSSLLNELKDEKKVTLAVADAKLGTSILKLPEFNIKPVSDSSTNDLFRAIRQHLSDLVPGMMPDNFKEMSLGLAHSLSRHKLKFSPDKVDVMIVHAVSLLDDLDKELNLYAMRVKEWYGWHFPELGKILPDNLSYARVITTLGMRSNAKDADLSEILPHEIETAVKAAADISMGTEIGSEDLENIRLLAEQVIQYSEYRKQLAEYLDNRMHALAPNLTELVGPLVGARLIAHAKSLMNLAKSPSSTIQILGAEKALFRALKTKHSTPKYGLIFHASLVGQASGPNKGKIARQLAAKAALGIRTDALAEWDDEDDDETRAALGIKARAKLENSLRRLEGKPLTKGVSVGPNGIPLGAPSKWDIKEARKYNIDADGLLGTEPSTSEKKRPLIEEVSDEPATNGKHDESDEEDDDDMEDAPEAPGSPSLASVSDDTDEEVEEPTKPSKKGHKKEPEKKEKRAKHDEKDKRRTEREERRAAKKEQKERHAASADATPASSSKKASKAAKSETPKITEKDYERLAKKADMSVSKFTKKLERGQIKIKEDGSVEVLSKKSSKTDAEEATPSKSKKSSKRKHEDDEEEEKQAKSPAVTEEKPRKKKKKHQKETEA